MDEFGLKDSQDGRVSMPDAIGTADDADPLANNAAEPEAEAKAKAEPEPLAEPGTEQGNAPFTVAMVRKGAKDSRGKLIEDVFFKRDAYAIFQADQEMAIQFSDEPKKASAQIKAISPLIPLRNKIQFLCSDFPRFDCYRWQIAEALHLGLEGQSDQGRRLLNVVMQNCHEIRGSSGRRHYMKYATASAVLMAIIALISATALFYQLDLWTAGLGKGLALMLVASAGGAVGALLSIAIAIRGRAVELDGDATANRLDARVRIVIGVISAGALYLVMASSLFEFTMGSVSLTGADIDGGVALLIGIAAGFLERLVPNLLEGSQPGDSSTPEAGNGARAG